MNGIIYVINTHLKSFMFYIPVPMYRQDDCRLAKFYPWKTQNFANDVCWEIMQIGVYLKMEIIM